MIRHCVFLRLAGDADNAELHAIMDGLAELVSRLDGCRDFVAGPNRDFEGKSAGHPFGFAFDADGAQSLASYAEHPAHRALGARLVALCGGPDGIVVYDLDV